MVKYSTTFDTALPEHTFEWPMIRPQEPTRRQTVTREKTAGRARSGRSEGPNHSAQPRHPKTLRQVRPQPLIIADAALPLQTTGNHCKYHLSPPIEARAGHTGPYIISHTSAQIFVRNDSKSLIERAGSSRSFFVCWPDSSTNLSGLSSRALGWGVSKTACSVTGRSCCSRAYTNEVCGKGSRTMISFS